MKRVEHSAVTGSGGERVLDIIEDLAQVRTSRFSAWFKNSAFRVVVGERRADHRDRASSFRDCRRVRFRVDAGGEARDDREVVADEIADQLAGARQACLRRVAGADNSDAAGRDEVPPALVVEQLNRVLGADSAEICHRFRCEGCHLIHAKPATHSGGKLPPVGAKRRGRLHCYCGGVVGVNFA